MKTTSGTIGGFNKDEIDNMKNLLGTLEKPWGSTSLTLSGKSHASDQASKRKIELAKEGN
ncbi:UBN2_3 domain-containing protein [Senna tora]|uniref:UBN2_3 domain-containing protein n=1 Tax=Senna tora TaxID=362788 RepID=A0A834SXG4_9FABA|nr:UBN2_3 domain-containing protein [Senna tora]